MNSSKVTALSFNTAYIKIIKKLFDEGSVSISRKGKKLTELHDFMFTIENPLNCMATARDMSYDYLRNEMDFYMSGSNKLEDAVKCSKFWEKCTDDGETVNSNYGKLIFYDRNKAGFTQFEHAKNCLINSKGSKKAVMTLYNKENAYLSNDNPCTMFVRARIDDKDKLHFTVVMRSSDIYYGLPYDVPFFVFVQIALKNHLIDYYPNLSIGTYTHMANSLHFYEYKREELLKAKQRGVTIDETILAEELYIEIVEKHLPITYKLCRNSFMEMAWIEAEKSGCFKKKVGCVFTVGEPERVLVKGFGDIAEHRNRALCYPHNPGETCARDDKDDKWFETGCPSIHAEHRALNNLKNFDIEDMSKIKVYVTHGPCDACLKMLDAVGIKKVYYDIPYKTDYSHWPNMEIKQVDNPSNREEGKSA